MRKLTLIAIQLLLISGIHTVKSQTGESGAVNIYDASTIPEELKKDAYIVYRKDMTEYLISAPDKAELKTHEVFTILDEKGKYSLNLQEYTDKYRTLEEVDIRVYDRNGKVIARHGKKDFMSVNSGEGLIEDGKIYYLKLLAPSLPVTVEVKKEISNKGIWKIPSYYIQMPNIAIEHSGYLLKYPSTNEVKFKAYHITLKPLLTDKGAYREMYWETRKIPASKYEEGSGNWINYSPRVDFNASQLKYYNFPVNTSSWKEAGLTYNVIAKDLNRLSPQYQNEIRLLVKDAKDDREKVRILYENLQKNFRYVSIQLGIGGIRPFPADFLHEKKYGDCKGLSNYMEACLAAVNIKSHCAWVYLDKNPIEVDDEFYYDRFNHVILCVPLPKDTIWLECTSTVNEFGHLGTSTENRKAVLLTDKGGVLVQTPVSKPVSNVFKMKTEVQLNEDGSGKTESLLITKGEFHYLYKAISRESTDNQKMLFVNMLGFPNPDNFEVSYKKTEDQAFQTQIQLEIEKIPAFMAGTKMFIKPRIYKFFNIQLPAIENRKQVYYLNYPGTQSDTTVLKLPDGFTIETLPKDKSIVSDVGLFESRYWYSEAEKAIYNTANLQIHSMKVSAEKYMEAKKFMDKILDDENQKLIIKKL